MTVTELIERLTKFPKDAEIKLYDPDSEQYESLSGFVFDPMNNTIELFSDEP